MIVTAYTDAESVAAAWLATTQVAPLVTRPDGGLSIYKAMPTGAPLPAVVLSRVGGAPRPQSDVPEDLVRLSFDCWGRSRSESVTVAAALVAACEGLGEAGGYVADTGRLAAAEVVSWVWAPDPRSDTPRYVVDALFSAVVG